MRLVTLRLGGTTKLGLDVDGRLVSADAVAGASGAVAVPASIGDALAEWEEQFPRLRKLDEEARKLLEQGALEQVDDARLGPPVTTPSKIICVGLNYADHAADAGMDVPSGPVIFSKFPSTLCGPNDEVVRPVGVEDLDYEAELAVVIGRRAKDVGVEDAFAYVAGYTVANDVSARNAQLSGGGGQWLRGKSFDTFCPLGPALVSADEVPDPQALTLRCRVDGEVRQDSTTANMVFGVAELISYLSSSFTLEPGDLILTGTPGGVALGKDPACWLLPGQICEVEIGGVGRLRNQVVEARAPAAAAGS